MNFKKIGKITGYIIIYFIFTTILFFILSRKIHNLNYLYTIFISLTIVLLGLLIKLSLK